MSDEKLLTVVTEIRNWVRAASHGSVKLFLETALPDSKARIAYHMTDGSTSVGKIREQCKMSPNDVIALQSRCVSLGLMEITAEKRRRRLFDLHDFGLMDTNDQIQGQGASNAAKTKLRER